MSGTSERTTVVFLNHWAQDLGGAEQSLLDILGGCSRLGERHLVTTEPGSLVDRAAAMGVTCHVIPCTPALRRLRRGRLLLNILASWQGMAGFALYVLRLMRLMRRLRPVLIHANVPKSHMALFALRILGVQGACCFHMREIFAEAPAAKGLYGLLWPRRGARAIAISLAVKGNLPGNVGRDAQVIHNGVSVPPLHKVEVCGPVRFIYMGRIVPWKGCHTLIDAFAALAKSRTTADVQFALVGDAMYWDGEYREGLRRRIDGHGIGDCCVLKGHTADPYAELAHHHVMLMASLREPFGRSAAEAHACGLPVVAFDSGGIAEVVKHGETGLLVPYGNVNALTMAMQDLVDRPDTISAMGRAAHERAERMFNKDVQVPLICNFLAGMIIGTGTPP